MPFRGTDHLPIKATRQFMPLFLMFILGPPKVRVVDLTKHNIEGERIGLSCERSGKHYKYRVRCRPATVCLDHTVTRRQLVFEEFPKLLSKIGEVVWINGFI